jgi:Leucine-rich repeat (LRR) protein
MDEDITGIGIILRNTLTELVLNHTTKISCPIISFPRLIRASVAGCFGLTQLYGFDCPNIKELNLSLCIHLTGNLIEKLVEQLPVLETLTIMKCSGVRSLDLKSNKLLRLDASFMHNSQYLRLVCPSLQYLDVSK